MSFSTFEITELREESDNDYAIDIQASECRFGVLVTAEEMQMLGEGLLEAVEGNFDDLDGRKADDYREVPSDGE